VSARIGSGPTSWSRPTNTTPPSSTSAASSCTTGPLVAILNNLEYDHADIFPDVAAIQRQFHHLVRTVPRRGRLIVNGEDERAARSAGDGLLDAGGALRSRCVVRVERAQVAR
jgi:UDP-N-acetylmuramate: L-alanyl-gamma-D-glutamyl-meso-diaminopimelate ligase